jgi:hypothetical protein
MEGKFITNEVRNGDGVWINSQVFREEGLHFMKHGYYCADSKGTASYTDYWDEQLNRCLNGYTSGGVKITQHHYYYLNYTQISIVKETGKGVGVKEIKMPDFWDGDYAFFWALEIGKNGLFTEMTLAPSTLAEREEYWKLETERMLLPDSQNESDFIESKLKENSDKRLALEEIVLKRLNLPFTIEVDWRDGGHHVIVGKSRRKGYSFKNAAICANIYNTIRNSTTIIGAFDKKFLYPKGTMAMASEYLSFLNKNTAWGKGREYVDKQEHKRASYKKTQDGIVIEAGYKSDIIALTFADNPDAARGKDGKLILFEEAGSFPNLKAAYRATEPSLKAGRYITGQIVIFGTGGDMEYGTTDFADMFYHPKQDNLMPFINIWDEDAENSTCGFFHPVTWNMEGYYDLQGNSDVEGAKKYEKKVRENIIKNSTDSGAIQQHVQEYPFGPAEAFLTVSMNDFPVIELRNQYNKVVRENLHLKFGQPAYLFRDTETGKVTAKPDLDGYVNPIWDYKPKTKDLKGGVVIYEYPIVNPPKGLYKIGFDPYRQQQSTLEVPSLASIYVYKSTHKHSEKRDCIVAQYVGRPYSPEDVNRIAALLAELYNTEVMHENEVTHVKEYFTRKKLLHLLAVQPDAVIGKAINNSKVARVYGCHMNDKLKDAGEKYIKQWLLEVRDYDENGNPILNLDTIYDPALLEELILYNRKGNFDRVMALMMVMFQIKEEEEGKEYGEEEVNSNAKDLLALMKNQYKKN